ncbi:MAG TPA: hypothetical protein VIK95_05620 [Egibacteraceae bacterium]
MTPLVDAAAVCRRDVGVVVVTGPERLSYLHTLLTQHLEDARPGTVADFLHLDAKGNALAVGRAYVRAEDVLLVTPRPVAADLAAALEKFKFLTDVAAEDQTDAWALASVRGPEPVAVPGARPEPMTAAPRGPGLVARDRSGGVDLLGPVAWVDEAVAELDLPSADAAAWEVWRIRAGEPAWGSEITEGRRAQELGLLPTHVHLRKGCYPGQESIAKIYNLGRPRRALAVVALDGPVSPGDAVEAGGKHGEVTSAAAVGGGSVALALLPLDRDGEVLGGGDVRAGDGVRGRVLRRVGEGLPQPGA